MAEAFAAYELIRGLCPSVEADAISAIDLTENEVRAAIGPRDEGKAMEFLEKLVAAIERLIERREVELLEAMKKALKASPPAEIDEGTKVQMSNFLMSELGQYYNHGSLRIRARQKGVYVDGLPPSLQRHEAKLRSRLMTTIGIALGEITKNPKKTADTPSVDIFISHSEADEDLATALVALLKRALKMPLTIRCTSVPGHGLTFAENGPDQIRAEVRSARVLLGLITPASMKSSWVLFELGARWGHGDGNLRIGSILAKGATPQLLPKPLRDRTAMSADNKTFVQQILEKVAALLDQPSPNPKMVVKELRSVVRVSTSGGLFHKHDGVRVKEKADPRQYFILNHRCHYLDEGAASICDQKGFPLTEIEKKALDRLRESTGQGFNTELMQYVLSERGGKSTLVKLSAH